MFYYILSNRVTLSVDKVSPCHHHGFIRSKENVDHKKLKKKQNKKPLSAYECSIIERETLCMVHSL